MVEIRDIVGLKPITWWPLAWGWWLVICVISILAGITIFVLVKRYLYNISWKGQANKRLKNLKSGLQDNKLKVSLKLLSTEIRSIAMHASSRHECAGLTAHRWLQWLEEHDPKGFVWTEHAALLSAGPYAPPADYSQEQVKGIIVAIQEWVKK